MYPTTIFIILQVKNQLQQYDTTMMGNNGTTSEGYYFFGCVVILPSMVSILTRNLIRTLNHSLAGGNFSFTDVPKGIFFNGDDNISWITLKNQYCPH